MKKLFSLLLIVCIMLSLVSCGKEKVDYSINLKDGNFESEETFTIWSGWAPAGTDHFWDELSHTDDGSGSLKITHYYAGASSSSWGQSIHVVENARYKISAWIKFDEVTSTTANGNGGGYIVLEGCSGYTGKYVASGSTYGSDWTYYEEYFTASFTGEATMSCRMWASTGSVYFDDIEVELIYKVDPDVATNYSDEKDIEFPDSETGFSVAVIGDPQAAVSSDPDKYYTAMTNIVKLKDKFNIQYVIDVGDLVDSCKNEQWKVSKTGHEIFDKAGLRYSLSMGNHDYGNGVTGSSIVGIESGQKGTYDHSGFENTYSLEEYIEMYGEENFGAINGTMSNTYHKFTYDGEKYIIIALEYAPTAETVKKAKEICDNNADSHIIVVSHMFLHPRKLELSDGQAAYLDNVVTSTQLWKTFISKCPNIFLVCCGHFDCYGTSCAVKYNDAGNPVTILQIDPQGTLNGSEVMTAFVHIENKTEVSIYTYVSSKGLYYNGSCYKVELAQGTEGTNGGVLELSKGYSGKIFTNTQLDGTQDKVTYTCTSSNDDVVTIAEDGTITCVGEGTATVTCIIDRHQSAQCLTEDGTSYGSLTKIEAKILVK